MSDLHNSKQHLIQKSIIPQQEAFSPNIPKISPQLLTIPKLQIHKQRQMKLMTIRGDEDTESPQPPKNNWTLFPKTQRSTHRLYISDRIQIMSEKAAQNSNLLNAKGAKTRRATEYSKPPGSPLGLSNPSPTSPEPSLNTQSPSKTAGNSLHPSHPNLALAQSPRRRAFSPLKPNQCSLQTVEKRIAEQKLKTTPFTDDIFPPTSSSIFFKKPGGTEQSLKMERLSKICEGLQPRMLPPCSSPSLLSPGSYTSPALYCSLSILSEQPARIHSLLGRQQFNPTGMYYVQLCKDGVWRYVIVDDYMPIKLTPRRSFLFLHMSSTNNNQFNCWPCIVEKAIAKVYGTYQDLYFTTERGVKELLRLLTGLPVVEYPLSKDFRTFLVIIDSAIKKNHIVVLQDINEKTAQNTQLSLGHSYQIVEIKKNSLLVRNPMNTELTTRLSFEQAMGFSKLMIFRSEDNYAYISRTLRHKKGCYSVVRVTFKMCVKCYWDIWENSEVYYKAHIGSPIDYHKSAYTIKITRIESEGRSQSCPAQQFITQSGKEITMGAGSYEVWAHLCQEREQDFTLSYYGEEDVELLRIKNKQKWMHQCSC